MSLTRQKSVFLQLGHDLPERITVANRAQAVEQIHNSMQFFKLYNFGLKSNLWKSWLDDQKVEKLEKIVVFTVFMVSMTVQSHHTLLKVSLFDAVFQALQLH